MQSEINVDTQDVIRLILQFCKENNLSNTFQSLQAESQVALNTVTNVHSFTNDILSGKWESVLKQARQMNLTKSKLIDLYEQIVIELCELREIDTAKYLMDQIACLGELRSLEPERYLRLEHLINLQDFDEYMAYQSSSKEERRLVIAKAIRDEVKVAPSGRLLSLIGQALAYQQQNGLIPPLTEFTDYDLFTGKTVTNMSARQQFVQEVFPSVLDTTIKFGKKSFANCAVFSPNGEYLVTGSVDGFVEAWDYKTGKLNMDLTYQAEDKIMMHDTAVLSVSFSANSEMLASGDRDGTIKVWNIKTGDCIRRIEKAHTSGVTSICFSSDSTQILSGSQDMTVRIYGLNSGKVLKQFLGHKSFINSALYMPDMSQVISGSSDGTVKLWDTRTMECLTTFYPNVAQAKKTTHHPAVYSVLFHPKHSDQLIISTNSPFVYITNMQGEALQSFTVETLANRTEFELCTVSPRGQYIYAVGENHALYCFNTLTGKLDHVLEMHKKNVSCIVHHPDTSLIATCSADGTVRLWKSN